LCHISVCKFAFFFACWAINCLDLNCEIQRADRFLLDFMWLKFEVPTEPKILHIFYFQVIHEAILLPSVVREERQPVMQKCRLDLNRVCLHLRKVTFKNIDVALHFKYLNHYEPFFFKLHRVFLSYNFSKKKELLINLMCYFLCMAKNIPCHQTIHITICLACVTMEELTIWMQIYFDAF
jgi:hypothetical protein